MESLEAVASRGSLRSPPTLGCSFVTVAESGAGERALAGGEGPAGAERGGE